MNVVLLPTGSYQLTRRILIQMFNRYFAASSHNGLLTLIIVVFQVRGNHVAPIYVINLLISDLIQFCSMIAEVAAPEDHKMIGYIFHVLSLFASIGFMVCIALER